jgi:hypothetical protein
MQQTDGFAAHPWLRAGAVLGIVTLGLLGILGSGGGALGLPSDCPPGYNCNAPPPVLAASVQPPFATQLVGVPVTFTASVANATGNLSYQWSRAPVGGAYFVDIAGATGFTYTAAAPNLADDATVFRVTVRDAGAVIAHATGSLSVSATPGLVFLDTEFKPTDWVVTPFPLAGEPAPVHSEDSPASGGNPGAFRKMVLQIAQQNLSARAFYTSIAATYDPRVEGAIRLIDYAEDAIALQPNISTSTQSAMLLEQAGRRYIANLRNEAFTFMPTDWSSNQSRASLRAADFNLIEGAACTAVEACPDFSAQGAPMRFGYWRISFGVQGDVIAHGIDNWKVTVWKR